MCDYYTCCRLCLHEAKDGLNCLNVPRFILAIRQIFGFEITTKDKCSTKLCHECIGKITNISMYRDFVLNNQKTIEDYQIFRSDILTLKSESIILDDDDVIYLCKDEPTEEPPKFTTKEARERVLCENVDSQKNKEKIIIAKKKPDVLKAILENEKVSKQTEFMRKEDKAEPATNASSSKTLKETPRSPIESNLTNKEIHEQAATEVLVNNNNASIALSKSVNEILRAPVVDLKLLGNNDKEQPTTNELSNNNVLSIGTSKTINQTQKSPVDSNLITNGVKEPTALNYNSINNGINTTIKKLAKPPTIIVKKIRRIAPNSDQPNKKQKLDSNSAPPKKADISALSTSKVLTPVPTSKPVHPLAPNSQFSPVQIYSINPPKFSTHSSQIATANSLQQNQKVVGPTVTTNTTVDSEYESRQFDAAISQTSNALVPFSSSITLNSKSQREKPLSPRFEVTYQQQAVKPKIQTVAPINITYLGNKPLNSVKQSDEKMHTNLNNQQNCNNSYNTSAALNFKKVKVLSVNQVNKTYLVKSKSTASADKTMQRSSTNIVSASHNSEPLSVNSSAQTEYSTTTPPYNTQQNVTICQSNVESPMCNKTMPNIRLSGWNRNVARNSLALPSLNCSQTQDPEINITFSIRLLRFNNEIQIKISNNNGEINFNNMNKFQLDAVRKSMLQPSSMAQMCKAFKSFRPNVYSKELLEKLGMKSFFPKILI